MFFLTLGKGYVQTENSQNMGSRKFTFNKLGTLIIRRYIKPFSHGNGPKKGGFRALVVAMMFITKIVHDQADAATTLLFSEQPNAKWFIPFSRKTPVGCSFFLFCIKLHRLGLSSNILGSICPSYDGNAVLEFYECCQTYFLWCNIKWRFYYLRCYMRTYDKCEETYFMYRYSNMI